MAHGIGKRDKQQGKTIAWHNLTQIKPDLNLNNNFLTEWDVTDVPIFLSGGVELPFRMLVATDDKLPIGKPFAKTYTPVKNVDFLAMIKEAISGVKGATICSAGSICDRGRVFVSVSIEGLDKYTIGKRSFVDYLNFGNSFDQTSAVWANASNICTVCNNTFNANYDGNHEISVRVKHSKDVVAKLENISEVIDNYAGVQATFKAKFEALMNEPMKEEQARNFYAGFIVRNANEGSTRELGPKSIKKVERLTELFVSGRGNNGDDRADCFQGGTEYFTHFSTRCNGKNTARQVFSSEYGLGNVAKQRLWTAINDEASVKSLITTGRKAISDFVSSKV
jgi:hypothetical protein